MIFGSLDFQLRNPNRWKIFRGLKYAYIYRLNTKIRLTILCLSGFELYFRWVPPSSCPRSTLRDFIAIAELKKVDSRAFEIALANYQGESVRELEQMCRKSLRRNMPLMSTMRREGQLLPLKFDQRFYEWSFTCNKNGFKSQWPIIKINW